MGIIHFQRQHYLSLILQCLLKLEITVTRANNQSIFPVLPFVVKLLFVPDVVPLSHVFIQPQVVILTHPMELCFINEMRSPKPLAQPSTKYTLFRGKTELKHSNYCFKKNKPNFMCLFLRYQLKREKKSGVSVNFIIIISLEIKKSKFSHI